MDTESMSTDKIQVGRHFSKSLQTDSSPYLLLFDLAETVLLISPSASLGWIPSLSLCTSLPAQGCFLSTSLSLSLSPFSLSLSLSLLHSLCPSCPICYLPAGSVLRCTAVGLVRIQAGWVTHSQSAALKPCRCQPHPRTPLLSMSMHECTSMPACTLQTERINA